MFLDSFNHLVQKDTLQLHYHAKRNRNNMPSMMSRQFLKLRDLFGKITLTFRILTPSFSIYVVLYRFHKKIASF